MQKIINVHSHILNFDFVPNSFFRTRAPVQEWMLSNPLTNWLARLIAPLLPTEKHRRFHELLDVLNKNIDEVAKDYLIEAKNSDIVLSIPLMMDLGLSSFNQKPEIPYRYQVKLISEIAGKYPLQIMPFVMCDPRRRSVFKLIETATGKMGFLGVKMYPSLGYHPDPDSFLNADEVNQELHKVYQYCERNAIPITTHCSMYGAYSSDLMYFKELGQLFCSPESWEKVLKKYPKLYLNFAHFGGSGEFLNTDSDSWCVKIQELMKKYPNVYADLSYHDTALLKKTTMQYFTILNNFLTKPIIKDRILFGTDWVMIRHSWTEKEYVDKYRQLSATNLESICFKNPISFLFPGKKLPKRIKQFYQKKNVKSYPQWIKGTIQI